MMMYRGTLPVQFLVHLFDFVCQVVYLSLILSQLSLIKLDLIGQLRVLVFDSFHLLRVDFLQGKIFEKITSQFFSELYKPFDLRNFKNA